MTLYPFFVHFVEVKQNLIKRIFILTKTATRTMTTTIIMLTKVIGLGGGEVKRIKGARDGGILLIRALCAYSLHM